MPVNQHQFSRLLISFTNGMAENITRLELITEHQDGFFTNQDVNVYASAFDILSTVKDFSFDGGLTWQSDNVKTYSINKDLILLRVRDRAGNITSFDDFRITNIDKVKPSCELRASGTKGEEDWYRSNIQISFMSTSDAFSGLRDSSWEIQKQNHKQILMELLILDM